VADADGTNALVIGGDAGSVKPSAWEHYFAAQPAADAGDPQRAYETTAAGLPDHPDNASLHYNLACYASLAGDADRAIMHITSAFELDPATRGWAESDTDLDGIRSDPRYPA
jgi:adenylate cyclase